MCINLLFLARTVTRNFRLDAFKSATKNNEIVVPGRRSLAVEMSEFRHNESHINVESYPPV